MRRELAIGVLVLSSISAKAGTSSLFDNAFEYLWSRSAELIVYGTIASVEKVDDPTQQAAYADVMVRVDSVQRGNPGGGTVSVRIDDNLFFVGEEVQVGKHGLWFLHRIRRPPGKETEGHLIRYMNSSEMANDLEFTDELMQFVIQDTIDQAISTDILNVLEPFNRIADRQVEIQLRYASGGILQSSDVTVPSGNLLFDTHVRDTIVFMHRDLIFPDTLKEATIQLNRRPRLNNRQ